MPKTIAARSLLVASILFLVASGAKAQDAFVDRFQTFLAAADLDAAEALARERADAEPSDAQAQFALGTAQFLQAVEGLGQGLYDHGLATILEARGWWDPGITDLPFLRMPVSENPSPTPFTAEAMRQILSDFYDGMAQAEATLAGVPKGPVSLPLDVSQIAFDYNRNGLAEQNEGLPALLFAIAGNVSGARTMQVGFDESDVTWLRGYTHLLGGIVDIILAHDFSETVNLTFQSAFPKSDLPNSMLNTLRETLTAEFKASKAESGGCRDGRFNFWDEETSPEEDADKLRMERCNATEQALRYGGIGDLIAFVHLFHWPVVEPERLLAARQHFLSMIALSRESWASILAETDDNAEWVPGPKQKSLLVRLRVDDQIVAGWMDFLDQAEGVLEGRLLLAHWRFGRSQGVNLRRMFEEPRTLDPVLILTGVGAAPYIEEGELAAGSTFETGMNLLGGGMLAYFLWFN